MCKNVFAHERWNRDTSAAGEMALIGIYSSYNTNLSLSPSSHIAIATT